MNARGLTLIETMLYIALLSMLAAGALPAGFALLSAASAGNERMRAEQEASFMLAKLDWALEHGSVSGMNAATTTEIIIRAGNPALDPIVLRADTARGQVLMREGAASFESLTDPRRHSGISFSRTTIPDASFAYLIVRLESGSTTLETRRLLPP